MDGWGTNLSASFFTEVLIVAFHELSLAVEVEALLQAPLVDHVQADLQAMADQSIMKLKIHSNSHLESPKSSR